MHLQKLLFETYCLVCRDHTKNNNPKIVEIDKIG